MSNESGINPDDKAFAKTLKSWQEERTEDLQKLCEFVDLDSVEVNLEGGQITADPEVYVALEDWVENLKTVESTETAFTDFLIGLIRRRR